MTKSRPDTTLIIVVVSMSIFSLHDLVEELVTKKLLE
jgi:hypothetical protein